jgi:putative transposase
MQGMGRSRGGLTTKVHLRVDGLGNPQQVILTPGQVHDITQAPALMKNVEVEIAIADKGYDSEAFVKTLEAEEIEAVIPSRKNRKEPREYDKHWYKMRNIVERTFNWLKRYRRIATRYEKTGQNFLGFFQLGCVMMLLR